MEQKSNKKIVPIIMTILPLVVAFAIQVAVSVLGFGIFFAVMVVHASANGIEWYLDQATGAVVSLYTIEQYNAFLAMVTVISELLMLLCGAIWYKKCRKTEVGIKAAISPLVVVAALVLGVGIQGVTSFLLNVIYNVFPSAWTTAYDELLNTMLDTSSPFMIISVVLLAPIAEELFFRGLMLNYGQRVFPVWVACLIQAVAFGILHMNPVQFTYATLIGLVLGLVALAYKSVWPGIIVHIAVNGSAEVLALLGVEIPYAIMTIAGAVLCIIAIAIHFFGKKLAQNEK